jgi:putative membrane protein
MHFLIRLLVNAAALYGIAQLNIGLHIGNPAAAVFGAIVLGICNALVRPILFFFTLPLTILTLGLFSFVVNALVFWLAVYLTPGFHADTFGAAFKASLLMWIVSWFMNHLFTEDNQIAAS